MLPIFTVRSGVASDFVSSLRSLAFTFSLLVMSAALIPDLSNWKMPFVRANISPWNLVRCVMVTPWPETY